ncbi:selenoprotein M [Orussus abietinus]|uniref:selenoprotein M n=1 Tax=Orussus abietinus TaxID=222816 RepID=UPI000C716071|nr:selenoprotein M [Orussus abietinus]
MHFRLIPVRVNMVLTVVSIFLTAGFLAFCLGDATQSYYAAARIESCKGCALERLPDVKAFIFEDVPLYENVEFQHIQGVPPDLVLLNEHEEEIERLPLAKLTRDECNELLVLKGFKKQSKPVRDEV